MHASVGFATFVLWARVGHSVGTCWAPATTFIVYVYLYSETERETERKINPPNPSSSHVAQKLCLSRALSFIAHFGLFCAFDFPQIGFCFALAPDEPAGWVGVSSHVAQAGVTNP